MLWIIGFLTVVLVLDSLILVLLVLVQFPKKEAGIGQAFGGGATDALFGAGSGNALTKMTKYTTGIFFALTLLIYVLYNHQARARSRGFASQIQQAARETEGGPSSKPPGTQPVAGTPSKTPAPATLIGTNAPKVNTTVPAAGNPKTRGLLTVPQAAPTPPPSGSAPTDNTAPKPAPATAK